MKDGSTIQPELNFSAEQLAEAGLSLALESAENNEPGWTDRCLQLFIAWLSHRPRHHQFTIEQFRAYLKEYDLIEDPPSLRAYGVLSKRGVKYGWIEFVDKVSTKGSKAHGANAALWRKK